jgi:hypothetical protein
MREINAILVAADIINVLFPISSAPIRPCPFGAIWRSSGSINDLKQAVTFQLITNLQAARAVGIQVYRRCSRSPMRPSNKPGPGGIALDFRENPTQPPLEPTGDHSTTSISTSPFSFCIADDHTSFPGPKDPFKCSCPERGKFLGDSHFFTE